MKHWINRNYKTLIITAFLIPIITVAIVSISHVTKWYGISNPVTWSIYLSIGIEIAALSALAAISANMGKKVYFPFAIVTIIQFIGNIFFAYSYINLDSQLFKDWVDLVAPLLEFMGVEPTDYVGHKRFLALFAGGMLPVISLSFLHMLVKFTEEDRVKEQTENITKEDKEPVKKVDASDLVGEVSRIRLSENDLKKLEEILLNPPPPNEALVNAAKEYKSRVNDQITDSVTTKRETIEETKEEDSEKIEKEILNDKPISVEDKKLNLNQVVFEPKEETEKEKRERLLIEMMQSDQELGLYDQPFENSQVDEETINEPTEEDWDEYYKLLDVQEQTLEPKKIIEVIEEPPLPSQTPMVLVEEPPTPTPSQEILNKTIETSNLEEIEKKKI